MVITNNATAESHVSSCGTVEFVNPTTVPQTYHAAAGVGTDCTDALAGNWLTTSNQTLAVGGGNLTAVEEVDTITVDSNG